MAFITDSDRNQDESSSTYTLRSIAPVTDMNVTAEAKTAGKPKGTYVREFLEEQLGDPVTSWIRSNALVASMDEDLAESSGAVLSCDRYEICLSVHEAQAFRAVLDINSNAELKRVLFDNAAYLHRCAVQELMHRQTVLRGISMKIALFCELAGRKRVVIDEAWRSIYHSARPEAYERYIEDIEAVREMKKLPPLDGRTVYRGTGVTVSIWQPFGYEYGAWRVQISLNEGNPGLRGYIPIALTPSRLLVADPGYTGVTEQEDGTWVTAMRFINGRCRLHMYTNGVSEADNPVSVSDAAKHISQLTESAML